MARRKRKFEQNIPDADKYINNLRYRDMKRECIIRGMEYDKVLDGTVPKLTNWLRNHFHDELKHDLLNGFDEYQEKLIREAMEAKGQNPDDVIHPSLRLGYVAETDADGNVIKRKRVRTLVKKKKKKRERTEDGIFQGTKKAMTYSLQQEGLEKAEVITMVMEAFPDASEKSIGIWFNKSRKLHKV